ncbi:MAG: S-layer protein, partial [Fuerstia sp.]|nr:S-layer protein [Fuerstiella sp.]
MNHRRSPLQHSSAALTLTVFAIQWMAVAMVRAEDTESASVVDFQNDLQPIFTRLGCNSGPCHGKARGQGGFQLSLLGFDPQQDYDAITKEGRGRRVFPAAPERSLLLAKPAGTIPHGGGRRLAAGGPEYQTMLNWVRQGMPRQAPDAPTLKSISVATFSIVAAPNQTQALVVTAKFSDGTERDVTRLTAFQSNEAPIAAVDETGLVTAGQITGVATIMARFMGQIAVCDVLIPRTEPIAAEVYDHLPRNNFIDELVWRNLQRLNITPSPVCDDHTFLRRATTDICGRI